MKQMRQAERDLEEPLAIPPAERLVRVDRSRSRFRGPVLAERLIQESRRRTPASPSEGLDLAELARAVVHRSPDHPDAFSLLALASAQMANACRAGGDLRQAEEHFRHVRYLVRNQGVTDPLALAQIDHLEGSLRKDQRRFQEAEELLTRSAMLFRISGDDAETARVLLKLGELSFHQSLLDRAAPSATSREKAANAVWGGWGLFSKKMASACPGQTAPWAKACPSPETFRGPRGLRKGVVQDLETSLHPSPESFLFLDSP
ncbi:MAG TPA: tetratricopeptide repeat protein [Thermoanaerobaculia bacterium]|nr:tetratricopeptide repeat protein [Thermoanaerobaculia bacterium]